MTSMGVSARLIPHAPTSVQFRCPPHAAPHIITQSQTQLVYFYSNLEIVTVLFACVCVVFVLLRVINERTTEAHTSSSPSSSCECRRFFGTGRHNFPEIYMCAHIAMLAGVRGVLACVACVCATQSADLTQQPVSCGGGSGSQSRNRVSSASGRY